MGCDHVSAHYLARFGTYRYKQSCDGQLIPVERHLSTVLIYVNAPEGQSRLEVELSDLVGNPTTLGHHRLQRAEEIGLHA